MHFLNGDQTKVVGLKKKILEITFSHQLIELKQTHNPLLALVYLNVVGVCRLPKAPLTSFPAN